MSYPDPGAIAASPTVTLPSGERIAVLFDADRIAARIDALAQTVVARLGPHFLVVVLLKGGLVFAADLLRALHRAGAAPEVDFLILSSYGASTESRGTVDVVHDLARNLTERTVLVVDDILESGRTLDQACRLMEAGGARSVLACVLFEKPGKRVGTRTAEFLGFTAPDMFLVGYGMDHADRFRELPFVGALIGSGEQPKA